MFQTFQWRCPFCDRDTTIGADRFAVNNLYFSHGNADGERIVQTQVIVCPNRDCNRFTLTTSLHEVERLGPTHHGYAGNSLTEWRLVPAANIRVFPDYIPKALLDDYREARLIRDLSPKASATLARRCLQGMIRDFWSVRKRNLVEEIEAIEGKVDPQTWDAIDAVRKIGNIGAHMEKDINVVVDVDPDEAELLIGLIETLLSEWYVARHTREQRMLQVKAAAAAKAAARSRPQDEANTAPGNPESAASDATLPPAAPTIADR